MYYYFIMHFRFKVVLSLHASYNIQGSTTWTFVLALCNKVTFVPEPHGRRHGTQSGPFLHLIYQEIKESRVISFFLKQVSRHEHGQLTSNTPSLQHLELIM